MHIVSNMGCQQHKFIQDVFIIITRFCCNCSAYSKMVKFELLSVKPVFCTILFFLTDLLLLGSINKIHCLWFQFKTCFIVHWLPYKMSRQYKWIHSYNWGRIRFYSRLWHHLWSKTCNVCYTISCNKLFPNQTQVYQILKPVTMVTKITQCKCINVN